MKRINFFILVICFIFTGIAGGLLYKEAISDDTATGHRVPLQGVVAHGFDAGLSVYRDLRVDGSGRLIVTTAGGGTAAMQVEGTNASATAVSGNPVNISGVFEATPSTVATGQEKNINITNDGAVHTAIRRFAIPVTVNTGSNGITADITLMAAATNLKLMGFSTRESAAGATVATFILRHGVVSAGVCSGPEIAYVELNANESLQVWYGDRGLAVDGGVCADVLAGTIDIAIRTAVEANP